MNDLNSDLFSSLSWRILIEHCVDPTAFYKKFLLVEEIPFIGTEEGVRARVETLKEHNYSPSVRFRYVHGPK